MEPLEFIELIAPGAREFHARSHVFASVTIAQAILETGWGRFVPVDKYTGQNSYNLFGIKGTGPAGSVLSDTWEVFNGERVEVEDRFRAYHSYAESIADHGALLMQERYDRVREAPTPEKACYALYRCGYATDPDYPYKLITLIEEYNLKQYDLTKEELAMFEDLLERLAQLENAFARWQDEEVSTWADAAVKKAQQTGTMVGDANGRWRPKAPVSREELAVVLDRLGLLNQDSRHG